MWLCILQEHLEGNVPESRNRPVGSVFFVRQAERICWVPIQRDLCAERGSTQPTGGHGKLPFVNRRSTECRAGGARLRFQAVQEFWRGSQMP
jgi:hypothetical protein